MSVSPEMRLPTSSRSLVILSLISEFNDPILTPLIGSRDMEKKSIGIPLCEPGDSGLDFPEVFFIFEHVIIVT